MIKHMLCGLLLGLAALPSQAGILAAGTRLIYPAESREKTLMLANTNAWPVIVQSWIDDGAGDPLAANAPFVVLPAVFRLAPGERQAIRIIYNRDPLPQDRESAFWINLYEIPPATRENAARPYVTLAMNTQLKLFWRPAGLSAAPEDAAEKLIFRLVNSRDGWAIECENPTPLNISFTSLTLAGGGAGQKAAPQVDMMIRPFSTRRYPLIEPAAKPGGTQVRVRYLGDNGAAMERTAVLQ